MTDKDTYRMGQFRDFVENQSFVEKVLNEFNSPSLSTSKEWSAKKADAIKLWKNLRPDIPILIEPMEENPVTKQTSSRGEDGLRIMGSWTFICSILSRLKEILNFENKDSRLSIIFKGMDQASNRLSGRKSYVFYVNVEKRAKKSNNQKTN